MSDDEEMTDVSQTITQSGSSYTFTSLSLSYKESQPDPWGRITIYEVQRKRLGSHPIKYEKIEKRVLEMVNERTTFGRSGDVDCNISDLIDIKKVKEISGSHFTIIKDVKDKYSPVFLEDTSSNGTFFYEKVQSQKDKRFSNLERIDEKRKRRILADKDVICIEKTPTICFEFQSLRKIANELPDDINRDYHIGRVLGQGACGIVYFTQNRRTCQPYAVKFTIGEKIIPTILKEVLILKVLKHPCILKLYNSKSYEDSVAIFLEFMNGGDLLTRIQKCGHLSESLTKCLFYQICVGIEYLHSKGVTHRDLKPENILLATVDPYTLVKISDFGLSKRVTSNTILQTQCGTRMYLAPEVQSANYTNKVDIWSLGVILYNLLTGQYPFADHVNYKLNLHGDEWETVSAEGKQTVLDTLQKKADRRPSAAELINQRDWLSKEDRDVQKACEIISNPNISQ